MAAGGAIYTRWGRTTCTDMEGTGLVYAGRAGATDHTSAGGASNYLCMPDDPDYSQFEAGTQGIAHVTGVEYYFLSLPSLSERTWHNAPCAVCYVSTRCTALMIPAKTMCPDMWTVEYSGFLTADNLIHAGRVTYECVDKDPESIPGLDYNGRAAGKLMAYFQLVEAVCDGLPCSESEYNPEKELTCVVCTR